MSGLPGRRTGRVMLMLAGGAGVWRATRFVGDWEAGQSNPNRTPASIHTAEYTEVRLLANDQGHFVASGRINGREVVFLLDTGATDVAVPEQLAAELGLARGQPRAVLTAAGSGTGYRTRIDRLSLGDIELAEVPALLMPGFDSPVVLLGMSALKHLEFTQRAGTLVLRQDNTERP